MKNQFNILILGFSMTSFSFYELEGPFGIKTFSYSTGKISPIKFLDDKLALYKNRLNTYIYLCLYNRQTGYSIGYVPPHEISNKHIRSSKMPQIQIVNFLKGKLEFQQIKWESEYTKLYFYFVKEESDLVLKNYKNLIKGIHVYGNCRTNGISKETPMATIRPSYTSKNIHSFVASTGIQIKNSDEGVQICKDSQSYSFEKALKNWFCDGTELDSINQTVIKLSKNATEKDLTKDELAKNSYELPSIVEKFHRGIILDKKASNLLKRSKILGVYGVFKNNEKNSIVWGIAEDINDPNRRKFPWITDLKEDISKLIE